ncbi:BTAD domain-containing putative transcriptional regulator [Streptomyces zhihengii]|uniref:AfsR/SARP family transcriptional regulator n=1 Tax=Streptomyces zhihengii TaxID=1818004 RepID=UPI00369084FC
MLHVRLLGPVDAVGARGRIDLGGAKPRALLAALALEPGRVVSATRLVDVVWSDDPPASARALVQTYVSTLRRAFAEAGHDGVIVTRAPGYALRSEAVSVDADRFARLLSRAGEAAAAEDFTEAAARLREARALWHGPALSGVADPPLAGEARRLDEMRLSAAEQLYAAELARGRLDHVAELTALVDAHPVNERLRGQLMITLHRLGRRADALACFRTGRDALVGELGIEPGRELRELHRSILQPLDAPPAAALPGKPDDGPQPGETARPAGAAHHRPPAHLPPSLPDFTGREGELRLLAGGLASTAPVHVVAGPGGSGKSVLAVHAAHQVAAHFPDGQLYRELRGMTGSPATTGEVLGGFLRALGVPERRLPESDQARVELYRTLVAGRRLLIVLDDAANEQQVRPLLPAGSGCAALVTARDRLGGLAGARLTELGALVPDESMELLTTIVGADRVRAEPDAAARILAACDHLPLALRIAGARLAMRSRMPLATLAERLDDERRRLDELCAGDLAVRSTISLSFGTLSEQARTALGRLGHLGLPDFSAWVVGWLLDLSDSGAQRVLDSLVDAQLVEFTGVDTTGTDRYRLHDLIRLFAREYAEKTEPAHVLRNTVEAPLHGWLALLRAVAATRPPAALIWQPSATVTVAEPPAERTRRVLAGVADWMEGEEPGLAHTLERAAELGLDVLVCEVLSAHTAVELGDSRYRFGERITSLGVAAAQRVGEQGTKAAMHAELARLRYAQDRFAEARAHYGEALSGFRIEHDVRAQAAALAGLGAACREPGHLAEALHFLDQAGILVRALDSRRGIGHVHRIRGSVRLEQGDYEGARDDIGMALSAYREAGSSRGIALALRTEGLYQRARGDYEAALGACAQAADVFAALGDRLMRSYAVRAHAKAQFRLGAHQEALPRLEWALGVATSSGDRFGQAVALRSIGQLHLARGRLDQALSRLDSAMVLWEAMDVQVWRARTEYDLSLVHAARGDATAAQACRTHAMGVFRERGAREFAEISGSAEAGAERLKHS